MKLTPSIVKNIIIVVLIIQLLLMSIGNYLLTQGDVVNGIINIVSNAIFIPVNINNLIKLSTR